MQNKNETASVQAGGSAAGYWRITTYKAGKEAEEIKFIRNLNIGPEKLGFSQSARVQLRFRENGGGSHATDDCRIAAWLERVLGRRMKNRTDLLQRILGTSSNHRKGT